MQTIAGGSACRHTVQLASGGVELRFTDHARRRMRQRHIDEAEVGEVLAGPDERRPSEDRPDRTVVIGTTPASRVLFVVVTSDDPVVVVTVAEQRQAPRR